TVAEVLAAVLRDQPADLDAFGTRFPPGLKQLVARCLAKQPADRFQSVNQVATALRELVGGEGDRHEPAGAPGPLTRPCVAGLPLQNFSATKAETDYLVDGLAEQGIAGLAKNRPRRGLCRPTRVPF